MTDRLYYKDSHLHKFSATVSSCEPYEGHFLVQLDRTAFFPEGGGQGADTGMIGPAHVLDVQERAGEVVHMTDAALPIGIALDCELDWRQRFSRMQNHSGEHILSGTIHALFGYDNVGFHMGENGILLDFNGELREEELAEVERLANEAVCRDIPVSAEILSQDALRTLEYRSKMEFTGEARIVTIPGVDTCACCAPHVSRTGEIGVIKILDSIRHRGGVRLTAVCGFDAFADYCLRFESTRAVSRALSAKQHEIAPAVERVLRELEAVKEDAAKAKKQLLACKISQLQETDGNLCLFEPDMDPVSLRELVNAGMQLCSGVCAAFCGGEGNWTYCIGSLHTDLRAAAKEMNAALDGRGGGSPSMIQGTARAGRADIQSYIAKFPIHKI